MVVETTQKCISKRGGGCHVVLPTPPPNHPPTCHHCCGTAGNSDSAGERGYLWMEQPLRLTLWGLPLASRSLDYSLNHMKQIGLIIGISSQLETHNQEFATCLCTVGSVTWSLRHKLRSFVVPAPFLPASHPRRLMWPGWLPRLEQGEPDVTEKHTQSEVASKQPS